MSHIRTRPLTTLERTALDRAMTAAITTTPYFAAALLRMRPIGADGLGTFGVDHRWRLYIDPAALDAWGPQHASGVLIHEVCHLLREHHDRHQALARHAPVDQIAWGLATDAAINADLIQAGTPLPAGAVTPQALGLTPGGIEESYYQQLASLAPEDDPADGPGCGSGAGDPAPDWELPDQHPDAPALSPSAQDRTRQQVAHDILNLPPGIDPSTIPAALRRWASDTLAPPQIDWRTVLRAAVRRAITHTTTGQADYTWTRPSRRRLPGIITPAMHAPRPTIAAVIDTSGSMQQTDIDTALAEIRGIARAACSRLTVIAVDTETTTTQRVSTGEQVHLEGGGGTDMRVGITEAQHSKPRPDALIVLTDGYTPWPELPTPQPLIIGLIGQHSGFTPPWAITVSIPTS